jgi:hypothetical protein
MFSATATAGFDVARFGDTAQLETLADIANDGLLDLLHFVLSIEKTARDSVFQERFAEFFELVDFGFLEVHAGVALLLEQISLGNQDVVLAADGVVGEESFYFLAQCLDLGPIEDGLAKFLRLLEDDCVFSVSVHKLLCSAPARIAVRQRYHTPHSEECARRKGSALF